MAIKIHIHMKYLSLIVYFFCSNITYSQEIYLEHINNTETIKKYLNNFASRSYTPPLTSQDMETHRLWFNNLYRKLKKIAYEPPFGLWVIKDKNSNDNPVGYIDLLTVSPNASEVFEIGRGEVMTHIFKNFRGKGIGTEARILLYEKILESIEENNSLNGAFSRIFINNYPSIISQLKAGASLCGYEKDSSYTYSEVYLCYPAINLDTLEEEFSNIDELNDILQRLLDKESRKKALKQLNAFMR